MTELRLAGRPAYFGARVARVEDDRLLTGRSRFVADIRLPGMVEMALVRSQFAHANVRVNLEAARSNQGVLSVVSAEDLSDVSPFP
ncbi:MAG: hypothetical protein ACT4PO_14075, partial [Actinomycetota bacterium]